MPATILTSDDLREFKVELLDEIKTMLTSHQNINISQKRFLRSTEVMELLGVSASTLQNLRIKKVIGYTKIGSTIFYDWQDLVQVFEQNKKAPRSTFNQTTLKFRS